MKIKKRELKTQLITLSLVLTTFLSSFSYVHAFGYSIKELSFTHGEVQISTNIGNEQTVYNHDSTDIINHLQFTFDGYYTGTVKLEYSYSSSNPFANINEWNVIVIGGIILSKAQTSSSAYITFQVTDRNEFSVVMTYNMSASISTINAGTNTVFNFTSATSSLSAITNHNSEYDNIAHIDAQIVGVNTNLNSIISKLTTANGLYTDILGNTNDIEAYLAQLTDQYANTLLEQQVGNIQLQLGNVQTQLTTLDTNQQTINTTLGTTNQVLLLTRMAITDIKNTLGTNTYDVNADEYVYDPILQCVNEIRNNMSTMDTNVNLIYQTLATMSSTLSTMSNTLSSISTNISSLLTTVQNIDNLIDKITWIVPDSVDVLWSNELTGDQTKWKSTDVPTNTYKKIYLYFKGFPNSLEQIDKLDLVLYNNSNYQDMNIKFIGYINGSNFFRYENIDVYSQYDRYHTYIYLYDKKLAVGTNYSVLEVDSGNYYTIWEKTSANNHYYYITSDDIEYWNLIDYFTQVKQFKNVNNFNSSLMNKLNDVIDAINNIQVTVNVTEQQITNVTNNFDIDIDVIHNVENNYKIDFDGWNNQLPSSDLALDLTPYNSTVSFLKTNITNLWSNPFVNLPILVSCLCFVFMVILG